MEPTDGGKWSGGTLVASVTRAKRYEGKGEERRKKGSRGRFKLPESRQPVERDSVAPPALA
jgi:hypothetical protein